MVGFRGQRDALGLRVGSLSLEMCDHSTMSRSHYDVIQPVCSGIHSLHPANSLGVQSRDAIICAAASRNNIHLRMADSSEEERMIGVYL